MPTNPKPPARPEVLTEPEGWERQTRAEIDASITGRPVKATLNEARHGRSRRAQRTIAPRAK
jgi:hypothetical protein